MGKRGAKHQSTDQEAERVAQSAAVPARCDLHPDRIDTGQKEAGEEAAGEQDVQAAAGCQHRKVRKRAEQRAGKEDKAGREPVRDREKREYQRPADEPELDCGRDVANRTAREAPLLLQVAKHGIARKPERGARELRGDDDRKYVPGLPRCGWHHGVEAIIRLR